MKPAATVLRHTAGQAMTEYLIITGVLVFALGIGLVDDRSVLWQLIAVFQAAYQNFSYSISLPT